MWWGFDHGAQTHTATSIAHGLLHGVATQFQPSFRGQIGMVAFGQSNAHTEHDGLSIHEQGMAFQGGLQSIGHQFGPDHRGIGQKQQGKKPNPGDGTQTR